MDNASFEGVGGAWGFTSVAALTPEALYDSIGDAKTG